MNHHDQGSDHDRAGKEGGREAGNKQKSREGKIFAQGHTVNESDLIPISTFKNIYILL